MTHLTKKACRNRFLVTQRYVIEVVSVPLPMELCMDYRQLFGIGFIIFALGFFLRSLQPAQASLPLGGSFQSFPYLSYTGTLSPNQNLSLATIPSDKDLIITGGKINSTCVDIYADSVLIVEGDSSVMNGAFFSSSSAHVKIPAGSNLMLKHTCGGYVAYYIEGYHAEM